MRRLVTWVLVTLGIAALVRKLRKREEPEWATEKPVTTAEPTPTPPSTPAPGDTGSQGSESAVAEEPATSAEGDPAAELRERLARSRADMPSSEEESPEERRAAVHEQGRATLDEMQPSGEAGAEPTAGEQSSEEQ